MAASLELSKHDVQGLCQRYLGEDPGQPSANNNAHSFQVLNYSLKPTSDAPEGFLGCHRFLDVEIAIKHNEGAQEDEVRKLRFFSKSAPISIASRMEYIEDFGVFKKEIHVYRDVLPRLQQIFADVAPKCYYADNNLLVFENLTAQDYRMAAGRDGLLNYEHLNCMLRSLAAMHAGSIVYELREGKQLPQLHPAAVIENAYPLEASDQNMRKQNFQNACQVLRALIKLLPKYQPQLEVIYARLPQQMARIFALAQVSTKYQNVFSHGDLWANNIMFQYGKFGETPIRSRFVDFQLARYAPPMLDLITVLTIPTTRRFREQYLSELLYEYYRYMSEFLKRENVHIEQVLPKQQFYECAEEFRIAGLIESFLFSHLTILPPDLTQHLTASADGFSDFFERKRVEICMEAFRTDDTYRARLTDMMEDLVDNFVLKAN